MSRLLTCCCCATEVIFDTCGECGSLKRRPEFAQRGVRMNTGTEHAIAFSARCVGNLRAEDWPRVLANNLLQFEESWSRNNVAEDLRAKHRAEMATWRILGWADQVSMAEALAR